MNQLFIARHGDYDSNTGELNEDGIKQIEELGNSIKNILDSRSIHIISSTAPRAIHSTRVLADTLGNGQTYETNPFIWSSGDAPQGVILKKEGYESDLERIVNQNIDNAQALLLMTHVEVTSYFTSTFRQGKQFEIVPPFQKGTAAYFPNFAEKSNYKIIPWE